MQYRDFGQIDFRPSALGFGAMRLPVLTDDDGRPVFKRIDYPLATEMLHRSIDAGVNYVDTAWMYHEDTSEVWLGEALKGGYRERVKVASKMPVWNVKKPDDFDRILGIQLERLQDDHIDFYLLHGLDAAYWKTVLEHGQLASAERALADGRIRHLGFSFHGLYEDFETILAATDLWEFVPDPVQLHGRGVPGRAQGAGAGGRQRPRRHRHGAGARRRHRAQRAAAGAGRVGAGAHQAVSGRMGAAMGVEQPGGVVPAQRHEHHAAGGGEPRVRRPLAAGAAHRRRARAGGARP